MSAAGFSIGEIERAALSSGMNSATGLAEVASHLTREHFTHFANQVIFSELVKLWEAGKPYDLNPVYAAFGNCRAFAKDRGR